MPKKSRSKKSKKSKNKKSEVTIYDMAGETVFHQIGRQIVSDENAKAISNVVNKVVKNVNKSAMIAAQQVATRTGDAIVAEGLKVFATVATMPPTPENIQKVVQQGVSEIVQKGPFILLQIIAPVKKSK